MKFLREHREGRGSSTYTCVCFRMREGRGACDTNGGKTSRGLESNPETVLNIKKGKCEEI